MHRKWIFNTGLIGAGALAVALVGLQPAAAATDSPGLLPNIDVRSELKVDAQKPVATQRLDNKLGPEGFADIDPQTGGLAYVGRTDTFLTKASDADPATIVKNYVRDHGAFGLDAEDLDALKLKESYTSIDGVTHVTFAQTYAGLESFDTFVTGNVTKGGRLINVTGGPVSGLQVATTTPALSADDALLAARGNVGGDSTVPEVEKTSSGPDQKTKYATYAESARLVIFAGSEQDVLAWDVVVLDSDSILYRVVVDAKNGDVLLRQSLTAFDNNDAQIWPHFPSALVPPTQVNFGTDPTWLDRSAANGNQLIGNNTHTYVDNNGTNGYQAGEEVLRNGGANWKYPTTWYPQAECPAAKCTWDSTNAATKLVNRNPGAVGLFYLTNHFHDHLLQAPIGFDEASRNFEQVNSSGQGVGNDAVLSEAQDSSGINNANFATPPDGTAGRMQMYLWQGSGPTPQGPQYDVDGSADAEVVYHEYGHGLSNRLVGNGGGLSAIQSGSMGEAWSDFYALDLVVAEGNKADAAGPDVFMGEYATGVPGIFGGVSRIRHQAIDCPVGSASPNCPASGTAGSGGYTYGDLGKVGTTNGVHDNGEIWSQTMWDLRQAVGRQNALKIITGGMRLSPLSPSMLDMRDAILQSAQVNGVSVSQVWSVFAGRGMGFFATTAGAGTLTATEDFSPPPPLLWKSTAVDDNAPRGDGDGVAEPGETLAVTATLQNLTTNPISDVVGTLTASSGTVTGPKGVWPTIQPSAAVGNGPGMAVTLPVTQPCSASVDLTVAVTGPGGPVAIPVKSVPVGQAVFSNSTDVPKAIPDNSAAGVNSTFTFPDAGTVQGLTVRIGNLPHTWVGDLKMTLTHNATTVVLLDRIGPGTSGSGDNNISNLVLDDSATTPVDNAVYDSTIPAFTGTYQPTQPLSAFNGQSTTGTWTLNVADVASLDTGTLNAWGLSASRVCDTFGLPASTTGDASGVGPTEATLNGTHNSRGHATDYRFEWGTSPDYGQTTAVTPGGAGDGGVPVAAALGGLTPSTAYHYRLVALRDGIVLSKGDDRTFTTAAPPVVKDATAPTVKITKAPKKKTKSKKGKATVSVSFTSEAGATFTCSVDGKAAKPCTSPFKTKVKAKKGKGKKHTIVVIAKDAAGNSSPPATVKFKAVRKKK